MSIILKGNGDWILRTRQEECVNKIIAAKDKGCKEFLLAAVCRFGKTITTLAATDLLTNEDQVIVVVSTMNVKDEWSGAAERVGYSTEFFEQDINKIDFENLSTTGRHLIYVSTQKLGNKSDSSVALIDWVNRHAGQHVLVYDECHLGSGTERTLNTFATMNIDFKVYLSGTPYRDHLKKMFSYDLVTGTDKSFIYGITEERDDFKNGVITDYIPVQLKMVVFSYIEQHAKDIFGKSLKEKEEELVEEQENQKNKGKAMNLDSDAYGVTSQFFKALFSEPNLKQQAREFLYSIKDLAKEYNIKNFLFFVPVRKVGSDLVKNFKKEFASEIDFLSLCDAYKDVLDTVESTDTNAEESKLVNEFFANNTDDKIKIAITCNKCGTGTTIKHLDAVCFLRDITNAISFIQKSQRVRTPEEGKTEGYCFCFNQWQGLKAFMNYSRATYDNGGHKAGEKESVENMFENGAIELVLDHETCMDFDKIVDLMGTYHPGSYPLFGDLDFTDSDLVSKFVFLVDFEKVKEVLSKKTGSEGLRKKINKAKNMTELRNIVGDELYIIKTCTPEDVRDITEKQFVAVLKDMYENGLTKEQVMDTDNYDQFIIDAVEAEFCQFDLWKELLTDFPRYVSMIYNYFDETPGLLIDEEDESDPENPFED